MKKVLQTSILLVTVLSVMTFAGQAQGHSQIRVSIQMKNATLKQVIQRLEDLAPIRFLAKAEDIEGERNIDITASDQTLGQIMDKVLAGRMLRYSFMDGTILIEKWIPNSRKADGSQLPQTKVRDYTLHGTIRARKTGEPLIGATVSFAKHPQVALSNEYGFYSVTLPSGRYTIIISAVGMMFKEVRIDFRSDTALDIFMEERAEELEQVYVMAAYPGRGLKNPQMSIERIHVEEISKVPVLFGERDILKTMQLLPGVKAAGDGNSGFYVRGGGTDQNLILLDEAPVYNASHLLGFFSTFNSDAIKSVTLHKGAMPPQYGGRLSSVVDIKMNDGNNQDFDVSGGIGLISSRLNIEGPIKKGASSFLLSGRRTYADLFLKAFGDSSLRKSRLYFFDLNAKMNFTLSEKDRLFLSGYFGRDVLSQDRLTGINWGNATATLRWNHVFSNKLFSNTSLIFSNFDYRINIKSASIQYDIRSRIKDLNIKEELQWYPNSGNTVTFGVNAIYHTIKPGEIAVTDPSGRMPQGVPDRYSIENAVYAGNTWTVNDKWVLNFGLRIAAFTILGKGDYYKLDDNGQVVDTLRYRRGEVVKTYVNPEPRIAAAYQLTANSSLKWSYARNTQNLHLISNSTTLSPTDKWVASTNIIKPQVADQVAIGYYRNSRNSKYEFSVEAYYKSLQGQMDYRNGARVFTNQAIETQLLFGRGRAYGLEWLLRKRTGKFHGWISYTISKTERLIDGINHNRWYNARQDRTHDVAIVGIYELNKKWTLSANWIYYTGDAVTFPSGKYEVDNSVYFYYSERNGYRMPDYHRLDMAATCLLKKTDRFFSELSVSIFNLYGRANAFQIAFRESVDDPSRTEAVKTSLFTFVPSITYNFKF